MARKRVVIVGAGGYSGAELVSILSRHVGAEIVGLFASARREKGDQPGKFDEIFPRFRALPHQTSVKSTPFHAG